MRPTSPPGTNSSARCRAGWSASASTRMARRPIAWRCRRASSTSGAKATSNICTAQVLPAVVASMYAVYHGPEGLKRIARRVASYTAVLAAGLRELGSDAARRDAFDTLGVATGARRAALLQAARTAGCNLRRRRRPASASRSTRPARASDISALWSRVRAPASRCRASSVSRRASTSLIPPALARSSAFLTHPVFNRHHSETEHAALPAQPGRQGPRARPHDDPARLVHDEAERDQRDDPDHLAGVRRRASVRAARPAGRLRCCASSSSLACAGHRLRRRQPAAQCRFAG